MERSWLIVGSLLFLVTATARAPAGDPIGRPQRTADALDSLEAALRIEHASLAKLKAQPDESPIPARNRSALLAGLADVGRVRDAVKLARHLIDLPRHPHQGSKTAAEGRRALLDVLTRYEGWTELAALETSDLFEPTTEAAELMQRSLAFGLAHAALDNRDKAQDHLRRLGELKPRTAEVEKAETLLQARLSPPVEGTGKGDLATVDGADRMASQVVSLFTLGRKDEARRLFEELRRYASRADLDYPPLARLAPVAKAFGYPEDWRLSPRPVSEPGPRPDLDKLGPFLYEPWSAPTWRLTDIDGKMRSSEEIRNQPTLMLFYLGNGCVHCVQQLQAFRPLAAKFAEMKINLVTVSTDTTEAMRKSRDAGGEQFPFVMLSDANLDAFRAFGAFDDFDKKPTHGLFLIGATGRVRWQDVGREPFTDGEFLLTEARRLLRQTEEKRGYREAPAAGSGLTPLSDFAAGAKYKGQDGGLYGREGNAPSPAHLKLIQEQTKLIKPLDADGKPSTLGRMVLLGLGGGPAADAFVRFKSRADRDADTMREVVLVDGTQSDQDAAAWADPKNATVWPAVARRLDAAGVTLKQVQAVWLCACLASPGKVGDYPKHTAKLQEHLTAIVTGLRDRYPNLRVIYLSSAAYAGYATDKQAGEPFAFETALAVRGVIQEQMTSGVKVPVLAWGPYLWADGAKARVGDGLVWKRDDFLPDGLRFSASGRDKAGDALLRFFQEDAVASGWFCKLPR